MTTDDDRDLAQALFRTLYDSGVSFQSGDLIPRLTATVRAAGFRRQGSITPPSDDDREALDQIMREADGYWPDAREAILATFRRQGPITDEMVADARKAVHKAIAPNWMSIYGALGEQAEYEAFLDTVVHAALEAAERARSAVPCVECSGTGWLAAYQRDGSATADSCRDCGGSGLRAAIPSTTEQEKP